MLVFYSWTFGFFFRFPGEVSFLIYRRVRSKNGRVEGQALPNDDFIDYRQRIVARSTPTHSKSRTKGEWTKSGKQPDDVWNIRLMREEDLDFVWWLNNSAIRKPVFTSPNNFSPNLV